MFPTAPFLSHETVTPSRSVKGSVQQQCHARQHYYSGGAFFLASFSPASRHVPLDLPAGYILFFLFDRFSSVAVTIFSTFMQLC
jgi:hypothetical protein